MRAFLLCMILSLPLTAQVTTKSKPTTGIDPDPVYMSAHRPQALALDDRMIRDQVGLRTPAQHEDGGL